VKTRSEALPGRQPGSRDILPATQMRGSATVDAERREAETEDRERPRLRDSHLVERGGESEVRSDAQTAQLPENSELKLPSAGKWIA
jgi:hypothetical protein